MPDLYSALPLLKGWKYVPFTNNLTLNNGAPPVELFSENVLLGFIVSADVVTGDANTQITMSFPGTDMIFSNTIQNIQAAGATSAANTGQGIGAFAVTSYIRPNPNNSTGFYVAVYTGGITPLPQANKFRLTAQLLGASNQQSTFANVSIVYIKIVDEEAFIQSYKDVFGNAS